MKENDSSSSEQVWKPSRFNNFTTDTDGSLLIYNSYRGALARAPLSDVAVVTECLSRGFAGPPEGILADLVYNGFFIQPGVDELELADQLHQSQFKENSVLQLILLPNENCNFRCKYCYESFARNKMPRNIIDAVATLVEKRAPDLVALRVAWFGGEPLTARKIIEELSERFQNTCSQHDIEYSAHITTNGYLLKPDVADMLFKANVRRFQITLDGAAENHDRLRVLADGQTGTFDRIYQNLLELKQQDEMFRVVVRVNFDPTAANSMTQFLDKLKGDFGDDPRFFMDFHPVGRWGGPNDEKVDICGFDEGRRSAVEFAKAANDRGFDLLGMRAQLEPYGSRCYAANPHSFAIGSDGTLYKCTVAFEDPRNQIGQLNDDGTLTIDEDKHAMWISNGEEVDTGCQQCSFRPACQGNACPKERMESGIAPCPTNKLTLPSVLRAISADLQSRAEEKTIEV